MAAPIQHSCWFSSLHTLLQLSTPRRNESLTPVSRRYNTAVFRQEKMANYSVLLVAALIVISLPVLTLFIIPAAVPGAERSSWNRMNADSRDLAGDRSPFSVRYFLIAVLFIVFDVETVSSSLGDPIQDSSAGLAHRDGSVPGDPDRRYVTRGEEGPFMV